MVIWPPVSITSTYTKEQMRPLIYKNATFEAAVEHLDFKNVIKFEQTLSPATRQHIAANDKLVIRLGLIVHGDTNSGMRGWLEHRRVSKLHGTGLGWHYENGSYSAQDIYEGAYQLWSFLAKMPAGEDVDIVVKICGIFDNPVDKGRTLS